MTTISTEVESRRREVALKAPRVLVELCPEMGRNHGASARFRAVSEPTRTPARQARVDADAHARDFGIVLDAARADAGWAYRLLYEDLAGRVCGYLRARGALEPEDLTNEVFLRTFEHLPTFHGDHDDFRAWVFTIARHLCIDEQRRRSARPQTDELPAHLGERLPGGDVEHEAINRLARDDVERTLDLLTPEQRDVIVLRVLGDLSVEQASRALGKRPGAIKEAQRRALARLRLHLEDTRA
jgi:RNA polymerase sigma factor (sigma-70 family)